MKAFFEEYGFVLVSIVVVMLLVATSSTVGNAVSRKISGVVNGFTFTSGEDGSSIEFTMPE